MGTVAVVGSREFDDYARLCVVLDEIRPDRVVSGGAAGADSLARRWCESRGVPIVEHLPDWDKYGKAAGPIRNRLIVADADSMVAFLDADCRGTRWSIRFAREKGIPVRIEWFGEAAERTLFGG